MPSILLDSFLITLSFKILLDSLIEQRWDVFKLTRQVDCLLQDVSSSACLLINMDDEKNWSDVRFEGRISTALTHFYLLHTGH